MFDKTTGLLSKALDLYLVRHAMIADNIANAETPGFKARRVDFENELAKANSQASEAKSITADQLIASVRANVYEDPNAEVGQDRNSVDMDREMAALSKNDVKYSAATQMVAKKFQLLKYAILEGNGS